MSSSKGIGRLIGVLLIFQMAGFIVPFVLLHPISGGSYLADAAAAAGNIHIAVLLLFINCSLTVAISVLAWKLVRFYSSAFALLLIASSVVMFVLQAIDNTHILTMLSLSERFAGSTSQDSLRSLAATVATTRKWTHYSELVSIDLWILLFHLMVYRFALLPRWIPAFGILTVTLHFCAIVLPMILGHSGITPLGASMALGHLIAAGWLIAKGFAQSPAQETWSTPQFSPA